MFSGWISSIVEEKISSVLRKMEELNENMLTVTRNAYILSTLVKENRETLSILMQVYAAMMNEMAGNVVETKTKNLLSFPRDTADDDLPN